MGGDFRLVAYFYTFLKAHPDRDQIWIAYRQSLTETLLVFVLILEHYTSTSCRLENTKKQLFPAHK